MFPYIILFTFPALMAVFQPTSKPWKSLLVWIPTWIVYTLYIGLRHEVGSDWFNYLAMFNRDVPSMNYMDALKHGDPAYWLLQVWVYQNGWDIHIINLVAAVLFMTGLVVFLRRLPNPWLGLVITLAYVVLGVAMGYVRQGIALGLTLWAITALIDRKFIKYIILIALAAAFHKTAVLMLGFGLFQGGKGKYFKALAAVIMGVGIYVAFMSGYEEQYVKSYIESGMYSSGAYIRVIMNAIPAFFFLWFRKRWKQFWPKGYVLWLLMAFGSVAALFLVPFATTVVDRMSLYFVPMQIAVFASLPLFLKGKVSPKLTTFLIVIYYALVHFVWLGFAKWAYMWLPYQNILFMN
ncbi:EpsG family protein [Sulfurovum sp. NBC37-1]|uniref:EpsG family protein n=1 Tax=Sulfurovum sp. (strain NBC37-1) TaxID=387093 RepID=UPI0001587B24|nr:EpsG family protein [Sulfurovum sp. NBC37-1]BAF72475.1 conserved hypothetical protein [Sulfurovum sp. NBC37-1]